MEFFTHNGQNSVIPHWFDMPVHEGLEWFIAKYNKIAS